MHETVRSWHVRRTVSMPPRMLPVRRFYKELLAPASRFRRPLSWIQELRLRLEAALVPLLVSSRVSFYIERGAPLQWRLVLNYLHREGIITSPSTSLTFVRNDLPAKKNVLLRSRLPAAAGHRKEKYLFSSGTHEDIDVAFSKAVGEVLERMSGVWRDGASTIRASTRRMKALRLPIVDPTRMMIFSREQQERLPRFRCDEDHALRWVACREIISGSMQLAPLDYFYWVPGYDAPRHPYLRPSTTSGMAGGFTRAEALESALREYIERDAFLRFWLAGRTPPRIHLAADASPRFAAMFSEAARCNIEMHFLDITCDTNIPVVACVLIHANNGDPLLTVGASAKAEPESAIISAYEEALSVMGGEGTSDVEEADFDPRSYEPFCRSDIGLQQRSILYRGNERLALVRFFYTGEQISYEAFARTFSSSHHSSSERIARLKQTLSKLGCRIFVHYPAHRALKRLRYEVVSVFIPELLPMYLVETDAPLGHPRLMQILDEAGRKEPYPYPHPFP